VSVLDVSSGAVCECTGHIVAWGHIKLIRKIVALWRSLGLDNLSTFGNKILFRTLEVEMQDFKVVIFSRNFYEPMYDYCRFPPLLCYILTIYLDLNILGMFMYAFFTARLVCTVIMISCLSHFVVLSTVVLSLPDLVQQLCRDCQPVS
jgi:hypothetical protein